MAAIAMAMDIFEGAQLRAGYILSLIDTNRTDPASPLQLVNLRDSVATCLQLHGYLTESCAFAWKDAFENQTLDYNETGTICILGLQAALKTFQAVARVLDTATEGEKRAALDSHFEEVIAKFRLAIPELKKTIEDFRERWPWFNESRLRESMEVTARGVKSKNTKDAFRAVRSRIQGQGT